MRGPGQAPFALEEPEHVVPVAHVVDRPVGRMLFHERLIRRAVHRPVDRLAEKVHPVAGLLAGPGLAQVDVGLLAGQDQDLAVGEALALVEHRLHLGQAQRAGVLGMAVAVELGEMDDLHAHAFEHARSKSGIDPWLSPALFLERRHRGRHVPVAGQRVIARQLREIDRRACSAVSLAGPARRRRLRGDRTRPSRWSVPGGALNQGTYEPPPRSAWRMPKPNRDSSPRWSRPYQTVFRLSVRSRGKKNWCGGGKHATDPSQFPRSRCGAGPPGGDRAVVGRRVLSLQLPLGVDPGESRLARRRQREAGVVENRPAVFLGVDDRFDVHQARSAIEREPELARERPDRDLADRHRRALALRW